MGNVLTNNGLSDMQDAFCRRYAVHLNGTLAATEAGYSANGAQEQASRLLLNVIVVNRIQELRAEINRISQYDALYVRKRLIEIDQLDVADIMDEQGAFLPPHRWPKPWRTSISSLKQKPSREGMGYEIEIKFPDKVKNLEMLGRHVDVSSWEHREIRKAEEAQPLQIEFNVVPAKSDVKVTKGG